MYINFKLSEAKGLIPTDIIVLQAIAQNKNENLSKIIDVFPEVIEKFEKQELIKYVKGKKDSSKGFLARLSDKGSRILDEIQTPEVTEDDLGVFEWLSNIYKDSDKKIGNAKKTKMLIAQFRVHSGIERNHLLFLCRTFVRDDNEMEYSKYMEYLFWKPSNAFQTKFDIEQSRLYQYYLNNKEAFDSKFLEIKN